MTAAMLYLFADHVVWAAVLFLAAAVTDYFDGYLARKNDMITSWGKIMDPIADKFLILGAFGMFARGGMIFWWIFWVIAFREVAVTLFRFWAMAQGQVLAAEQAGKAKTVIQITAVVLLFALVMMEPDVFSDQSGISVSVSVLTLLILNGILLFLSVIVTAFSGASVFWNNRALLHTRKRCT